MRRWERRDKGALICLLLLLCLSCTSLITFPLFLSLWGCRAYIRAGAAPAKQLSGALGRHPPVVGQVWEEAFFYLLNVRLLDFGIMPRKKGEGGEGTDRMTLRQRKNPNSINRYDANLNIS